MRGLLVDRFRILVVVFALDRTYNTPWHSRGNGYPNNQIEQTTPGLFPIMGFMHG